MNKPAPVNMEQTTGTTDGESTRREEGTVWHQETKIERDLEALGEKTFRVGSLNLGDLSEVISWQIAPLRQQARELLDAFWLGHENGNKERGFANKSILGCRMRTKGDSIYLEWFYNRWVKMPGGKSKPFSTYIKRGKGLSYTPASLLHHAKDWEVELVLATEAGFALVRRQNQYLAMARQNVREAKKSQDKFYADSSN